VVLIAGGIAAFLIWDHADLGVLLIVALTPLETFLSIDFAITKALKLCLVAFVACRLLAGGLIQNRHEGNRSKDPYRAPFYLLLATGFCTTLLASSPTRSALGLASLCIYVVYFVSLQKFPMLVLLGPRVLRTIMIVAVPTAVLALLQLTQGYGGMLGSREQQATEEELVTLWPSIERASGAFNSSNAAGAFLAIAVLVGTVHAVLIRKHRVWYSLGAVLCAVGVLATFSRGALLGLLCGLGFALWGLGHFRIRWRFGLAASLILISIASLLFFEDVRGYLRLGADLVSTSESRFDAWQATATIVHRHPLLGIGFYEFQKASQGIEGITDTPLHPHNGFLKALVEQGPLGGLAYLLFFVAFLKTTIKGLRENSNNPVNRWVLGSIGAAGACLFAHEFFDAGFTIGGSSIAILFATLLAIQVCMLRNSASDGPGTISLARA
jgi:hypothetical protein